MRRQTYGVGSKPANNQDCSGHAAAGNVNRCNCCREVKKLKQYCMLFIDNINLLKNKNVGGNNKHSVYEFVSLGREVMKSG